MPPVFLADRRQASLASVTQRLEKLVNVPSVPRFLKHGPPARFRLLEKLVNVPSVPRFPLRHRPWRSPFEKNEG